MATQIEKPRPARKRSPFRGYRFHRGFPVADHGPGARKSDGALLRRWSDLRRVSARFPHPESYARSVCGGRAIVRFRSNIHADPGRGRKKESRDFIEPGGNGADRYRWYFVRARGDLQLGAGGIAGPRFSPSPGEVRTRGTHDADHVSVSAAGGASGAGDGSVERVQSLWCSGAFVHVFQSRVGCVRGHSWHLVRTAAGHRPDHGNGDRSGPGGRATASLAGAFAASRGFRFSFRFWLEPSGIAARSSG